MYQTLGLNLLLLLAQNRLAEFHTVGYSSLFVIKQESKNSN